MSNVSFLGGGGMGLIHHRGNYEKIKVELIIAGGTQQIFIWGDSALSSDLLHFYMLFLTGKVPLSYSTKFRNLHRF